MSRKELPASPKMHPLLQARQQAQAVGGPYSCYGGAQLAHLKKSSPRHSVGGRAWPAPQGPPIPPGLL
ncbi:Hypothetical protein FKW44_021844 [Caligus rogercresseyi]|uniref:Uncharacterized protein n=1 Tax=Caligus rogercresseyi TaxID=217165 RepID=A0A7T8GSE6_CALRO|nr:Hypothetical protein FKW44_021844 [Caligus rogercresseyi]